jgi:hypothetical protein
LNAIGVECGHALGSVEGGNAPAGPGADVDEASAPAEGGSNEIDRARDLRQGAGYGQRDSSIFSVDKAGNVERRFLIEVVGGVVGLFGAELAEHGFGFADWSQLVRLSGARYVYPGFPISF